MIKQDFKWIKENYGDIGVSYESTRIIEAITQKDLNVKLFK